MTHTDRQMPKLPCILFTVLLCFTMLTVTSAQITEQLARKVLASTVYLEMKDGTGEIVSIGSGFFVEPNLIATNYHVVEGAERGTAKLVGRYTKYTIEGFTVAEKSNDLILLKVSTYGVKPLLLGDSDRVNTGAQIYVAGNPEGFEGTFSDGIISGKRGGHSNARLQMTAPISPGSSGGPVVNLQGEVVGVSSMSVKNAQNLNFAIPSNYLKTLLALSGDVVRALSALSPTISADTYFIRGRVLYKLGDYRGAIEAYSSAIRLKSDFAEAYLGRGAAQAALDEYFGSISDFDTAIRLKPGFAEAYVIRGMLRNSFGQHFSAISDFNVAIRLKPDFAEAYLMRGISKALLNRIWEAKRDLQKAWRLYEKARDAEGKAHAEKALRLLE